MKVKILDVQYNHVGFDPDMTEEEAAKRASAIIGSELEVDDPRYIENLVRDNLGCFIHDIKWEEVA